MKDVLITGGAGFVGYSLHKHLAVNLKLEVDSIDNFQPVYGTNLSKIRSDDLFNQTKKEVIFLDLRNITLKELDKLFSRYKSIIHLAAFPGVRLGQNLPHEYLETNIEIFNKIIKAFDYSSSEKLFFASSSSIYGDIQNGHQSREIDANGINLKSTYAMTKWVNELVANSLQPKISKPICALRFFTAIGSMGRPDMAYWNFTKKILNQEAINLYGNNGGYRSFTDISDLTDIVGKLLQINFIGFQAFNVGNDESRATLDMVEIISKITKIPAKINYQIRPEADLEFTNASLEKLQHYIKLKPFVSLEESLAKFVAWFQENSNRITY